MKQVILNQPIVGLDGEVIASRTGRVFQNRDGSERPEVAPLIFADLVKRAALGTKVKTDEEVASMVALANKMIATLAVKEPDTIQVTEEEYTIIKRVIDNESVIARYRFLKMVASLNS